jgi:CheY-like chemotaxis protein
VPATPTSGRRNRDQSEVRVLLLEDDRLVRASLLRLFERRPGWRADATSSNEEALVQASTTRPDIVLMDFNRPGGDAFDFLARFRRTSASRGVPVVVMTGDQTKFARAAELRIAGASFVMAKPVSPAALLGVLALELGSGEPSSEEEVMLGLLLAGREDEWVDYKETLDLSNSAAVAAIAKDVIAMWNRGDTGYLFFGVAESADGPVFSGLNREQTALFEPTRLNDALQAYTGQHVTVRPRLLQHQQRTFAAIVVESTPGVIALAHRDHERAKLYRGRIYLRTSAARSEEVHDPVLLTQFLERHVLARTAPADPRGARP